MPQQWFPTAPSSVKRRTHNVIEVQVKATPTGCSPIPTDDDGMGAVPSPSPRLHQGARRTRAEHSSRHDDPCARMALYFLKLFPLSSLFVFHRSAMPTCTLPCTIKGTLGPLAKGIEEHARKQSSLELSHTKQRDLGLDLPFSTSLVTPTTSIQAQITLSHHHWT
jgi:hypothetical protein